MIGQMIGRPLYFFDGKQKGKAWISRSRGRRLGRQAQAFGSDKGSILGIALLLRFPACIFLLRAGLEGGGLRLLGGLSSGFFAQAGIGFLGLGSKGCFLGAFLSVG